MLGSSTPRLWTPPLRELTPATSYGFDVIEFAGDVLGSPLDPWEEWLVVHAGELLPDGRPRFRKVLVIVARQNGKTHVLVVLSLFWLFVECVPLVLGTSTNLGYAKESWQKAVDLAESHEELAPLIGTVRKAAGEEALVTLERARYRIAAANRRGGRSLTIHRLILDELREHDSWDAWNAAYNAMNAVPGGQAFAITNQGDARAVVLESLRADAIEKVNGVEQIRADADPRLGVFEWSALPGSDPEDAHALALANPNLNRHTDRGPFLDDLLAEARRAKRNGGEELAQLLTEILCLRVQHLDPAIDMDAWSAQYPDGCLDPGDLGAVRSSVALVFDVSMDQQHVALLAAAQIPGGRVRVEPVAAWTDTAAFRREFPALVRKIKPRKLGWFPNGPSAAVAAELVKRKGWPPAGVELEEIRGDVPMVCLGYAEQVASKQIAHSGDPLLDAQTEGAERQMRGDAWVFTRRGAGHVNAVYAAAGAVHLARTLPAPVGKPRIVRSSTRDTPEKAG